MTSKLKNLCKSVVILFVGFTVPVSYHSRKEKESK